ncbi:MAG: winged helix-turn-helix transcriptional regulator [Spirochaetia bacterium]|nr:winged helix-turn-helix transcriptional regulator [Spirochaetia bacterium]
MPNALSPKELLLIQHLDEHQNQRSLAKASGFSLGMTNLLLKRLVKKGYVKVTTLNGRTLRYILTPVGFAEKVRRSFEYLVVSIRQLNDVKNRIRNVILAEGGSDRRIWVMGQNELAGLTKDVLRDVGIEFESVSNSLSPEEWERLSPGSVILLCDPDHHWPQGSPEGIKLVELPSLVG